MNDPCSVNTALRAFVVAPDPTRYYPAAVIEEARQKIARSIERGEGPALIVGAPGTGKTLLLEVLAQQFRGKRIIVSLPGAQLCSRRALLQMILFELEIPFRGMDEGELRVSLHSYLRPHNGPARQMLLLVDEADSLPGRLLEELRVLTNVTEHGRLLVNLVLAGSSALEERFAEPQMEVLSQRVSTRCYLASFGREETFQYIRAQVAAAGQQPDELFAADGLEAMYAATDGVPRLLNQLGDQLMWMAQETGYSPLDGKIVQQAWSELQQLPAPWNTPVPTVQESAVEFGELPGEADELPEHHFVDDAEDDMPASIPIHGSRSAVESASIDNYSETIDVTEQLFEQLREIEAQGSVSIPQQTTTAPLSHNPFEEVFDTEEVVLDHYAEYESQLLAAAQRVINQVDTTFATQLRQFEVHETPEVSALADEALAPAEESPLWIEPLSDAPKVEPSHTYASDDPAAEVAELAVDSEPKKPGDLLVIEDLRRPDVSVVPADKLRHLFSSLESGSSVSCMG